jgi:hypothetical protein
MHAALLVTSPVLSFSRVYCGGMHINLIAFLHFSINQRQY